ncbi:MAG: nicotinate (nicotinamide) nucleotide adenylyltransferase [Gemmatimonadales bacterium]|nr:nicotinate (nicotinamide) nucleotide adenylyltransferase [Gemmatimonadales bacterium]
MVGLFGGSFDPIHHGHLLVAQAAMEALALEELRFVPARQQPFKAGNHGADAADRVRMVELAIAGEPQFQVERFEVERPGPSFTVETLRALRAREPSTDFVLLVGADAAAELPTWHEAGEIARLAQVVMFARPAEQALGPAGDYESIRVPQVEISASAIRRRVRAGQSIQFWVPEAVRDHIAAHRLYLD